MFNTFLVGKDLRPLKGLPVTPTIGQRHSTLKGSGCREDQGLPRYCGQVPPSNHIYAAQPHRAVWLVEVTAVRDLMRLLRSVEVHPEVFHPRWTL